MYTYFRPSLCVASVVVFLHLCASKLFLDVIILPLFTAECGPRACPRKLLPLNSHLQQPFLNNASD
jgi:hypothetical protein